MYLRELTLDHFRSYEHLSLVLEPGLTLVVGDNGAGKSNLLEAIYALATTRSGRASSEGEVIAWEAPMPPIARVAGTAQRSDGPISVELAIVARTTPDGSVVPAKSGAPLTSKRLRTNGIARRASEVIGLIGAVLFTTLDIEIISGSPRGRRRYLDMMIAQSDREYARTFSRYDKGLTQRNALLKRIGEGQATTAELLQWDDVVVEGGALIIAARSAAVRELASAAATHHRHVGRLRPSTRRRAGAALPPSAGRVGPAGRRLARSRGGGYAGRLRGAARAGDRGRHDVGRAAIETMSRLS